MRIVFILLLVFSSCATNNKKVVLAKPAPEKCDSIRGRSVLQISFEKEDYVREELVEKLKQISANYKKLNSIPEGEWMSIEHKKYTEDQWQCEAGFYKYVAQIDKIIVRKFGKKSQQLQEYYMMDGKISLVKESEYDYESKELLQVDSYFLNGVIEYQFDNQDCGAPNAKEYNKEEERRIKEKYSDLLKRFSFN